MRMKCDPIDMTNRKTKIKQATIVVVDDDAGIRESLKDLLALENWDCAVAPTAEEGLALIEALKPELVVTDVQLPDMSGYQLCQSLKRNPGSRHVPVVMITGRFTEPDDKVQGFESGADEFFSKPFDPVLFVARIRSILRGLAPQAA
jgi:DNA-binding response OmpR family regulator